MDSTGKVVVDLDDTTPARAPADALTDAPAPTETPAETPAPKYGPQPDGTYLTPFQITVLYHERSHFETAIAALSARAQLLAIDDADFPNLVSVAEFITPEVLVFGDELAREDILAFLARGFQLVHIFSSSDKYLDDGDSFNKSVVVFHLDTLYEHVCLMPGLATNYALEYVICGSFPGYKSQIDNSINHETGKQLLAALEFHPDDFAIALLRACTSMRAFDEIASLVQRGVALGEISARCAARQLDHGVVYELDGKKIHASAGLEFLPEIIQVAPLHRATSEVNYVLVYHLKTPDSWHITLIGLRDNAACASVLKKYSDNVTEVSFGAASAVVARDRARELLTFL